MNISTKCNCCIKEDVCNIKSKYENAVKKVLECNVSLSDGQNETHHLKDVDYLEVSIKCRKMFPKNPARNND